MYNVTRHALRWTSPACVKIRQGFSCIDRPADWRLDLRGAQIASSRLRFETTASFTHSRSYFHVNP